MRRALAMLVLAAAPLSAQTGTLVAYYSQVPTVADAAELAALTCSATVNFAQERIQEDTDEKYNCRDPGSGFAWTLVSTASGAGGNVTSGTPFDENGVAIVDSLGDLVTDSAFTFNLSSKVVGVGAAPTDPTSRFHVESTSSANVLSVGSGTDFGDLHYNDTLNRFELKSHPNGTTLSLNASGGGFVSVGTSVPSARFTVHGQSSKGTLSIDGSSGCVGIRDTDDLGWTCRTTLNGVSTEFCCTDPSACLDDCP